MNPVTKFPWTRIVLFEAFVEGGAYVVDPKHYGDDSYVGHPRVEDESTSWVEHRVDTKTYAVIEEIVHEKE
jgi:hypothetical protein